MKISRKQFISGVLKLVASAKAESLLPRKEELRPVLLQQTSIAGIQFYDAGNIFTELRKGQKLILKAEPENKYDKYAVEVFTQAGIKLGYLPRTRNKEFYNLSKAEIPMYAVIEHVWSSENILVDIRISVYQMV